MATKSSRTNSKKGPRSIAKDLRSAASALEHGRHSTAQKKLAAIAPSFSPLSLGLRKDLSHDEAATTLAALCFWQEHLTAGGSVPRHFDHFEDATPLSIEEIDVLCEEINLGPNPQDRAIPETAGPLESLVLADHCEMCGKSCVGAYLEAGFNPDGHVKTLCRDCRIGSAELLADTRKKLIRFVKTIARMKTEQEFGEQSPASEDWISTLNDLIVTARKLGDK